MVGKWGICSIHFINRLLLINLLLFTTVKAESTLDGLPLEQYLAAANAVIVFTSQDGLSSGVYNFTNTDTQMRMYNLPLQFHFDPISEHSNLFVITDMGYSDTRNSSESLIDTNGTILTGTNQLQSYILGAGLGVRTYLTEHSAVLFGGEFIYSRLGVSERVGDGLGEDDVTGFFGDDIKHNYSYKLFAEYVYKREVHEHKVVLKTNYKLYKTLNEFTVKEVVDGVVTDVLSLQSQTSVASLMLSYETSPLARYHDMSFTLEPFVKGNYVWGDLADVAQISGYGTLGLSAYWNTPAKTAYIYRYFIEPSISKGDGLEGLNLSIGFSLDF